MSAQIYLLIIASSHIFYWLKMCRFLFSVNVLEPYKPSLSRRRNPRWLPWKSPRLESFTLLSSEYMYNIYLSSQLNFWPCSLLTISERTLNLRYSARCNAVVPRMYMLLVNSIHIQLLHVTYLKGNLMFRIESRQSIRRINAHENHFNSLKTTNLFLCSFSYNPYF